MIKTNYPNGIKDFKIGSNGWGVDNNYNLALLNSMRQSCVLNVQGTLPTLGVDGDSYINADTQEIAIWYENKWNKFPYPSGSLFLNDSNGFVFYFDKDGVLTQFTSGAGDNLGNHTATQDLDIASNNVINAGIIEANNFEAYQSFSLNDSGDIRFSTNLGGGVSFGYEQITSDHLTNLKSIYGVNTSSNPVNITLSDADKAVSSSFRACFIIIADIGGESASNPITIAPESGLLNGSSGSVKINENFKSLTFFSDGVDWYTSQPASNADTFEGGFLRNAWDVRSTSSTDTVLTGTSYIQIVGSPQVNLDLKAGKKYLIRLSATASSLAGGGLDYVNFGLEINSGGNFVDLTSAQVNSQQGEQSDSFISGGIFEPLIDVNTFDVYAKRANGSGAFTQVVRGNQPLSLLVEEIIDSSSQDYRDGSIKSLLANQNFSSGLFSPILFPSSMPVNIKAGKSYIIEYSGHTIASGAGSADLEIRANLNSGQKLINLGIVEINESFEFHEQFTLADSFLAENNYTSLTFDARRASGSSTPNITEFEENIISISEVNTEPLKYNNLFTFSNSGAVSINSTSFQDILGMTNQPISLINQADYFACVYFSALTPNNIAGSAIQLRLIFNDGSQTVNFPSVSLDDDDNWDQFSLIVPFKANLNLNNMRIQGRVLGAGYSLGIPAVRKWKLRITKTRAF